MNTLAIAILIIYAVGALIAIPVSWVQLDVSFVINASDGPTDAGMSALFGCLMCVLVASIWPALLLTAALLLPVSWLVGKGLGR